MSLKSRPNPHDCNHLIVLTDHRMSSKNKTLKRCNFEEEIIGLPYPPNPSPTSLSISQLPWLVNSST